MRSKWVWMGALSGLLVVGSASALPISGTGLTNGWGLDWGTYSPVNATPNHSSNVEFRYNTVVLNNPDYRSQPGTNDADPSDVTYPGAGGQNYDAEAIFYAFTGDETGGYLHLALLTGFDPYGESSGLASPSTFYAGDLFIDLGNEGSYDFAIAMGLGETRSGTAWAWDGSTSALLDPYYDGSPPPNYAQFSSPYRLNENAAGVGVTAFNASDVRTGHTLIYNNSADRQRWLYEARLYLDGSSFDLGSLLGTPSGQGGIGLHWTMECGNDYIHVTDSTPLDPVVPVPAAAPMALVGMLALGLVRRVRAKK